MVQIRRCHHGFSMPLYKEIIIHSYSVESRLFTFCPMKPQLLSILGAGSQGHFLLPKVETVHLVASAFVGPSPEDGSAVGSNPAVLCAVGENSAEIWEEMRCAAMLWTIVGNHQGGYREEFHSFLLWKSGIFFIDTLPCISSICSGDCYLGRQRKGKRGINN